MDSLIIKNLILPEIYVYLNSEKFKSDLYRKVLNEDSQKISKEASFVYSIIMVK